MKINGINYYKPSEIAKLGLLFSRVERDRKVINTQSVLRIIREGKLKTKNVGKGKTVYYAVSMPEINRYNEETKIMIDEMYKTIDK